MVNIEKVNSGQTRCGHNPLKQAQINGFARKNEAATAGDTFLLG
jgi:hypothetical protein